LSTLNIGIVSVSDVAGGAEAHTVALASGLASRGHDVVLYGRCPGWDEAGLARQSVQLGPKWSRKTLVSGVLRIPVERRRALAVPQRSVFYMQFKREQLALTKPVSRRGPVVWTEHGRWMQGSMGRLLLHGYATASQNVAKVVCVSAAVAEDIRQVVDPEKVVVVPNAVDTDRFSAPSAEVRSALRAQVVPQRLRDRSVGVIAARLHPNKRHGRAIAAAIASGSGLLILGDGPAREALERDAGGDPDVVFLGHRDNVTDFLRASDYYLFCGSPTGEGMPTSILEAAACGLPIVAFQGDPCLEFVDRCGGMVLAEPTDLTADAVAALLALRGKGVAYIQQHHTRDGFLDAYERIFRECTS
jgi:glycosyltransferase involved in cell wall biosynthesis